MRKIEEICRNRKKAHSRLLDLNSKTYRAFLKMERAAFSEGDLSRKTKELIAVGISVVLNCESCMEWHLKEAARNGATLKEVLEAVEVGMEMGGGPATAYARFALDVMEEVFNGKDAPSTT
jgi:AhpD family alkylhydroperoxidase